MGGWRECHRVMTLILATDSPDGANSHSAPLRGLAGAMPLTLACSRLTALYFLSVAPGAGHEAVPSRVFNLSPRGLEINIMNPSET